jgi:hypothetical protein
MHITKHLRRRAVTWATAGLAAAAVASALSLTAASAAPVTSARPGGPFTFSLVPSPGIKSCLPHAGGRVTIVPGAQNDTMHVSIFGVPRHSDFDLFVIEQPNKPFGVSWYQSDVNADSRGFGQATVRGVFDVETFSVSPGGSTTFGPTHQYHPGLWFNDPNLPFRLGCEPGATQPVVTPFNGGACPGPPRSRPRRRSPDARPLSRPR